jgi:hypothetical protein
MTVHGFDNTDDMFAWMRQQERAANANVTPDQAEIGYGDYWVRICEDIYIFGYVPTQDEQEASERELGADDEEIEYQRDMLADAYARGYRYGKCYSAIEIEGEWGSTHISTMTKITKEMFEEAQSVDWGVWVE